MKVGIFGGSFNPIHIGHAIIANHVIAHSDLDQIWLIVAPRNPLKEPDDNGYDLHRIRMTELVSRQLDGVETSSFEFSLPKPSYTCNTLKALSEKFPNHEFSLIIGADNWALFKKWKNWKEIIQNHDILIYPRLGYDVTIPQEFEHRVKLTNAPIIGISSTQIRKALANGESMRFYLPDNVYNYILQHKLYQNE
ncbi:MAG: nicotinate-nucleotide adenylyltransferase [Muribaculaceae bacterium]|nr:nicotinate-nucleotide adenylyltransferase [Muribaculaceae bacterium]